MRTYYSNSARRRSLLPPGRYFRMLLVGYFEGLDSELGIEWRCADSLSLREFLMLSSREAAPDHSWLSKTRSRLLLEVDAAVFAWASARLDEYGLIKGGRASRQRRGLPRDVETFGQGKRDRDADCR